MLLALCGFFIALWLLSVHLRITTGQASLTESCSTIIPVDNNHGCASIAVSAYSKPLGIPLPALAMGFYFSLFSLCFWAWRNPQSCYEPLYFAYFMASLAIPVTMLMAFIAKTKVHGFCPGCAGLWTINLCIWPALVKQLGLRWGNALGSLSELITHDKLRLQRARVMRSLIFSGSSILIFCVIGFVAATVQSQAGMFGDKERGIKEYQEGNVVFLNADMFTGPQIKGVRSGTGIVMDIVEFSDLQCPACRMAAQYFRPFMLQHGNEVRFAYHNYPLDGACNAYVPNGMHHMGCASARAAICAGNQDKFFEFHDQAFDNQESLSDETLAQAAQNIGLDMDKFNACLKDPQTESRLQKDIEWGESVKVEFTPTIIINGHKMGGALAPSQLEALFRYLSDEKSKH